MLKLIIIPAFILTGLAIYAAVEEAMEWRHGKRQSPQKIDAFRQWIASRSWNEIEVRADGFYERPINRLRMWLANIIAP